MGAAQVLTDDDLDHIRALVMQTVTQALDEHDAKRAVARQRTAAAEKQRRYRERLGNKKVTSSVTRLHSANGNKKVTHHVTFNCTKFEGITDADFERWQEAYPAIPIPDEVERAAAWIAANPKNKKSNYERFLVGWFTRAQDRAARAK